nr:MAG TPA: PGDYG protein [Bacteriophage sp.]
MINKYRKKPVIVEAVIWTGNNIDEVKELAKSAVENIIFVDNNLYIETLEGNMHVSVGDYVIKGIEGEFYPCKPNIFKKTYETVSMVSDNDRTTVPMSQYIKLENKNKKLRNTINRLKRELEVED